VKVPRSGGQACRKAGSAEGAAMRPLPGRPQRDAGSKPYHKANGTLTVLKWKNNGRTLYPQTRDKNFIRFSADANTVGRATSHR